MDVNIAEITAEKPITFADLLNQDPNCKTVYGKVRVAHSIAIVEHLDGASNQLRHYGLSFFETPDQAKEFAGQIKSGEVANFLKTEGWKRSVILSPGLNDIEEFNDVQYVGEALSFAEAFYFTVLSIKSIDEICWSLNKISAATPK